MSEIELPPYTCDPNIDVLERIDIYDSLGNWQTGFRGNWCTALWFCNYYELTGQYGPNYPLEPRENEPPPPPEPEPE